MLYWIVIPQIAFICSLCKRIKNIYERKKKEYRILGNSHDDKYVFDVSKNNKCRILGNSLDDKDIPEIIERKKVSKKAQKKVKKFSWLFCAKANLRKSDKCNRYICIVFIFQSMCLWIYCIINHLKLWILIANLSLIVISLIHVYIMMHAC